MGIRGRMGCFAGKSGVGRRATAWQGALTALAATLAAVQPHGAPSKARLEARASTGLARAARYWLVWRGCNYCMSQFTLLYS
jgi:hypothetical protein